MEDGEGSKNLLQNQLKTAIFGQNFEVTRNLFNVNKNVANFAENFERFRRFDEI